MTEDTAEELRSLLYHKMQELMATIEAMEIMPDHVHLLIEGDPTEVLQRLANQFKGHTSRDLRQKFP